MSDLTAQRDALLAALRAAIPYLMPAPYSHFEGKTMYMCQACGFESTSIQTISHAADCVAEQSRRAIALAERPGEKKS